MRHTQLMLQHARSVAKRLRRSFSTDSRAVVVLGMHRSGTSLVTRGIGALGVFLGDDFLRIQSDNPTGYWEDCTIVELNKRLMVLLGLDWDTVSLIDAQRLLQGKVQALYREAIAYVRGKFIAHQVWGFKDPRTIRILPFWRAVFEAVGVYDQYVVSIRDPASVASSLLKRNRTPHSTSHELLLVHIVPYLHEIAHRPFVVVDFDLLIENPRAQLERVSRVMKIDSGRTEQEQVARFCTGFVDSELRHAHFTDDGSVTEPETVALAREAYGWLYQLATDSLPIDDPTFWAAWRRICMALKANIHNTSVSAGHGTSGTVLCAQSASVNSLSRKTH